jgi:hypothetical protein
MISNIQATEEFISRSGWHRVVTWEYNGVHNKVECKTHEPKLYEMLIKTLVDAQIDKKVPYYRVTYIKEKNK